MSLFVVHEYLKLRVSGLKINSVVLNFSPCTEKQHEAVVKCLHEFGNTCLHCYCLQIITKTNLGNVFFIVKMFI